MPAGSKCGVFSSSLPILVAWLSVAPAMAQTLNYDELEEIYGQAITTSATGVPQKISDAPVTMDIITAAEIKRSGVTNIADILARLAGVNDVQPAALDHSVALRGYNSPTNGRLLVLVNGRQVYLDFAGFTDWSSLPVTLEEIRQIEVVKGPNTALFGFNAASGVINIVTYNPAFDSVNAATVRAGNDGEKTASGVMTEKIGDSSGIRLSAGYETDHEFKDQPNQVLFGPAHAPLYPTLPATPSSWDLNGQGVFSLSDATQLMVEATTTWTQYGYDTAPYYVVEQLVDRTYSYRAQVTQATDFGLLSAQVYRNRVQYNSINDTAVDENLTVAQIQDLMHLGASTTFRVSGEWRQTGMNSTPTDDGVVRYKDASGSLMIDQRVSPIWEATAALRFDDVQLSRSGAIAPGVPLTNADWDRSISEVAYNVGLVGHISDDHSIRLIASRGLQMPSLFEYALQNNLAPAPPPTYSYIYVLGNPALNPTVVYNYEVGWDWHLAGGAQFHASAYYETNQKINAISSYGLPADYIIPHGAAVPTAVLDSVPFGHSDLMGLEASYSRPLGSGFSVSANATLLGLTDHLHQNELRRVNFDKTTPQFEANASLGWQSGPWTADAYVTYVSPTQTYEDGNQANAPGDITQLIFYRVDGYVNLDARIAYRLDHGVILAVEGRNLLDNGAIRSNGLRTPTIADLALRYEF